MKTKMIPALINSTIQSGSGCLSLVGVAPAQDPRLGSRPDDAAKADV
jgi:hypothetical protein